MEDERIALFLDYENLAIGARDNLGGMAFDFKPIADALAEQGRIVVRRAYADWSYFDQDRRDLTRHHIELIDIPQKMGASRKNSADIKLAVDAVELSFERDYITTFVIGTGDSDFTPLMHKLRELNRRVIGIGIRESTSDLLPPACDEFLFYDNLEGVETPAEKRRRGRSDGDRKKKRVRSETDELGVLICTSRGRIASMSCRHTPVRWMSWISHSLQRTHSLKSIFSRRIAPVGHVRSHTVQTVHCSTLRIRKGEAREPRARAAPRGQA
jgi:uncharacterized LabA/DUF88 family protein